MKSDVPWVRVVLAGIVAGIGAVVVGQFVPPYHVLTHEFTQAFTVFATVVLFYLSAWLGKRTATDEGLKTVSPIGQMRVALTAALVTAFTMATAAFAAMAVANAVSHHCNFGRGVAFYWITWPPPVMLACVGGTVLGARRWRWRSLTAVLIGVVALSLVQDGLQALFSSRISDVIIGSPLGFDQRAHMDVPQVHVYQRAIVLAFAIGLWYLALWRNGRRWPSTDADYEASVRNARNCAVILLSAVLVVAVGTGSHIGLGWGSGALHARLSESHRTEHFVFRYPPGGDAELQIDSIARGAEWDWRYLCTQWGIAPAKPVHVYVFDSWDDLPDLTDIGTHAGIRTIYLTSFQATSDIFLHELVHALHIELKPRPTVLLSRGMLEGLAMAYEVGYACLPEAHRTLAGALAADRLPSATVFMKPGGFVRIQEGNAYDAAGSFLGFLIYEHGFEKFRALQRTLDFEAVYDQDLEALDKAWREFLEKVPVDLETQRRAAERFDADVWVGYVECQCPKLEETVPPPEDKAVRLWHARDYVRAYRLYLELNEQNPKTEWAYQAAQCLRRMERFSDAVGLLDETLGKPDLQDYEKDRLLTAKIGCLMEQEDWPALYAELDARKALEKEPRQDRVMTEACLRDPEIRSAVARTLIPTEHGESYRLLKKLLEEYPDNEAVRFLFVSAASQSLYPYWGLSFDPANKEELMTLIDYVTQTPNTADEVAETLLRFAKKAAEVEEFDLAEQICGVLIQQCTDVLHVFRAQRMLDRVAFERGLATEADDPLTR